MMAAVFGSVLYNNVILLRATKNDGNFNFSLNCLLSSYLQEKYSKTFHLHFVKL